MVSVIVPCYNQSHFLSEALDSILNQSYEDWECIIVNDGSTDHTEKVALSFCQLDKRFRYIFKVNGGLSSARNEGLNLAKGKFIQFLDADDILDMNKFSKSISYSNNADIIISNFQYFINDISECFAPSFNLKEYNYNFHAILLKWDSEFVIPIHCGFFRSALFSQLRFNENLKAKEDWLMWIQIYTQNIPTAFVDDCLAFYRQSGNGMSQDKFSMEQNTIVAYRIIFKMLQGKDKDAFFEKIIINLNESIINTNQLIKNIRYSSSYRIGNFFVRLFLWVKNIFKK